MTLSLTLALARLFALALVKKGKEAIRIDAQRLIVLSRVTGMQPKAIRASILAMVAKGDLFVPSVGVGTFTIISKAQAERADKGRVTDREALQQAKIDLNTEIETITLASAQPSPKAAPKRSRAKAAPKAAPVAAPVAQ